MTAATIIATTSETTQATIQQSTLFVVASTLSSDPEPTNYFPTRPFESLFLQFFVHPETREDKRKVT